ncbi:hypothetical protein TNCT_176481 [Trichonephila clavata]|uniref:Uncharacterized protein n=1 Tax=Trichonephila clavata TaxID=2740835 RepID=A0A8X6FN97_TRICU|nr:hypothetical protein TNCT_176481 [Trichonephila clavata]
MRHRSIAKVRGTSPEVTQRQMSHLPIPLCQESDALAESLRIRISTSPMRLVHNDCRINLIAFEKVIRNSKRPQYCGF